MREVFFELMNAVRGRWGMSFDWNQRGQEAGTDSELYPGCWALQSGPEAEKQATVCTPALRFQ